MLHNARLVAATLVLLLAVPHIVCAQSKAQLEKDKVRLEKEIKQLNRDLAKAKQSSRSGQQHIKVLDKKIGERTKLINNINGQVNLLNTNIGHTQDTLRQMRNQIDSMKDEYARVVRRLYGERGSLDAMVLLLDTKSYNHAFLRTKYFHDYSRYRRRQARHIERRQNELNDTELLLVKQKREAANLLAQEKQHRDQLAAEKKQQSQQLSKSQQKERDLQAQITKKETQKRKLQQQIQKLINEEIAKANKQRTATGSNGTSTTTSDPATDQFASAKGQLPWPVYYTRVSREYGKYTHSSGGQNMNNGIDLLCKSGTAVQSIAQGTVSRIFTCPNGTKGIIIRHGQYMSVYANMGTVTVRENTKVSQRQNLGTVYTNSDGAAEFSFQLWKGTSSLNPRTWLR